MSYDDTTVYCFVIFTFFINFSLIYLCQVEFLEVLLSK